MASRKVPARDIIVQVESVTPGTWLGIGGVNSVTVNLSENEEKTETTDFASAGRYEELVMQRGASLAIEGSIKKDHLTGVQDTGQARCEVIGDGLVYASLGAVRFRHPADALWKVWTEATFSLGEQGGDNNAMTSWSVTITRSGASTTAAVV